MNKQSVCQLILQQLRDDLEVAVRAAQTAYETATHEENIAENKYDTVDWMLGVAAEKILVVSGASESFRLSGASNLAAQRALATVASVGQ